MNVNFAERAHNHNWKLDPIVRSLLDTDFYKLLMLQFIWKNFPQVDVTSEVTNRTVRVRLAERVGAPALIEQMEHVRQLRFRRSELVWLAGNTFYGTRWIFEPAFLDWLEHDFRLSAYTVSEHDGQLVLRFTGLWSAVTMWEVYALAIVSELKTRAALAELSELELDVLYARAKTRLWDKIELLRDPTLPGLSLSDFGTRRRHSFLWQEYCVQAMRRALNPNGDPRFSGTSNTALAYKHDLEAIGTNAHELPMALAAMASRGTDDELRQSQYRVLELWQQSYGGSLLILLPDTFGTTQFLHGAPDWVASWTGQRIDSKDPVLSPATSTSPGSSPAAKIPNASASSPATALTSTKSSTCTATSTAASASRPAGARCLPTTSAAATPAAKIPSSPSALSANSPAPKASPPSSSPTTPTKPPVLPPRSSATAESSAPNSPPAQSPSSKPHPSTLTQIHNPAPRRVPQVSLLRPGFRPATEECALKIISPAILPPCVSLPSCVPPGP